MHNRWSEIMRTGCGARHSVQATQAVFFVSQARCQARKAECLALPHPGIGSLAPLMMLLKRFVENMQRRATRPTVVYPGRVNA